MGRRRCDLRETLSNYIIIFCTRRFWVSSDQFDIELPTNILPSISASPQPCANVTVVYPPATSPIITPDHCQRCAMIVRDNKYNNPFLLKRRIKIWVDAISSIFFFNCCGSCKGFSINAIFPSTSLINNKYKSEFAVTDKSKQQNHALYVLFHLITTSKQPQIEKSKPILW